MIFDFRFWIFDFNGRHSAKGAPARGLCKTPAAGALAAKSKIQNPKSKMPRRCFDA
jgi:hypothetical protein